MTKEKFTLVLTLALFSFRLGADEKRCIHHICIYYPHETNPTLQKYMSPDRCLGVCAHFGIYPQKTSNDPIKFRGTNFRGDICEVMREDTFLSEEPRFQCPQGYVLKFGHGMESMSRQLANHCVTGFVKSCNQKGLLQVFDLGCSGAPPDPAESENPFHHWETGLREALKNIDCPPGTRMEISTNQTYGAMAANIPISEIRFVIECRAKGDVCVNVKYIPCSQLQSGACSRPGQFYWCQGVSEREQRLCCITSDGEKYVSIPGASELKCPIINCSSAVRRQCFGDTGEYAKTYRSLSAKEVLSCNEKGEQKQLCCRDWCGFHAKMFEEGQYSLSCRSEVKTCPKELKPDDVSTLQPSCQISIPAHFKSTIEEGDSTQMQMTTEGFVLQREIKIEGDRCFYELQPSKENSKKAISSVKPRSNTKYSGRVVGCYRNSEGKVEFISKNCEGVASVLVIAKFWLSVSSYGPGKISIHIKDAKGKEISYEGTQYSGLFLAHPSVKIEAIPDNGSRFRGWFGSIPLKAEGPILDFTLDRSLSFEAAFEAIPVQKENSSKEKGKASH